MCLFEEKLPVQFVVFFVECSAGNEDFYWHNGKDFLPQSRYEREELLW
jgi:hypothetical protein